MKRSTCIGILKRAAMAAAFIAFTSSGAWAASKTEGSIYGQATPGESIVVHSLSIGLSRAVIVGSDGHFRINDLPPGEYSVTLQQNGEVVASRSHVIVQAGIGTDVRLGTGAAQNLGTIKVVGGSINPIDVSSTNTSLVLTSAEFKQLPVPRDITSVALLAPSTLAGSPNFGFGVSFGGSSIAENAYYLDGLNVTDMQEFLSFAVPPFEGLEQYQVLTGGYGPKFGNALGGVVNIVTKSGTNQFHAGANVFWTPPGLRSKGPETFLPNGDHFIHDSYDEYSNTVYNVYGSGPIIRDHLFFYALYQGQNYKDDLYAGSTSYHDDIGNPEGLLKLDWNINDRNRLTFTGFSTEREDNETIYSLDPLYSTTRTGVTGTVQTDLGSRAYIGKYTGTFTDNFSMTAMYGYVYFDNGATPSGVDCPVVYNDIGDTSIRLGCWSSYYIHPKDNNSHRHQYRLDFEWQIGPHDVTFGYDHQDFVTQYHIHYSGGHYWLYEDAAPGNLLPNGANVPAGVTQIVRKRIFTEGGTFEDIGDAAYIQDKWRIGNWYVRLGLRDSRIDSKNANGNTYIKFNNEIAPRLGFSWDVNGDGSLKIYGDLGRYFIPIPTNESVITAGARIETDNYYTFTGMDSTTGAPTGTQEIGGQYVVADGKVRSPQSVAAWNLKSMSNDELILGAQQRIGMSQWSVGIRGIRRVLVNGEEDTCQYEGFARWAEAHNYDVDSVLNSPTCIIVNPGSDVGDYVDIDGDGQLEKVTIENKYLGLPDMERYYNAVELLFQRAFDGKWFLNGSLTWSHNYGNAQGYVKPATGQEEAGTTTNFDHTEWTVDSYGNLPQDHRWVLKVFGAYNFTPEWRVGFNVLIHSGMPISCLGTYPNFYGNHNSAASENISHFCGDQFVPQGSVGRTPRIYRLDGSVQYSPAWAPGLQISLAVFNVLNSHHATHVSEFYDDGRYAGQPGSYHYIRIPSYLVPDAYQTFRYARVSVEYDW
ncbi:MAG TPA: TonB-dependent receptor [Gammaproteobacteria bacterium]|nr:TonB-dependent receptor [Gammaproteobacteria bacterium]